MSQHESRHEFVKGEWVAMGDQSTLQIETSIATFITPCLGEFAPPPPPPLFFSPPSLVLAAKKLCTGKFHVLQLLKNDLRKKANCKLVLKL